MSILLFSIDIIIILENQAVIVRGRRRWGGKGRRRGRENEAENEGKRERKRMKPTDLETERGDNGEKGRGREDRV